MIASITSDSTTRPPQNSDELTIAQAGQISAAVGKMLGYRSHLLQCMNNNGFDKGDKFYRLVADTQNAVHALNVEVHYLSCKNGVLKTRAQMNNGLTTAKLINCDKYHSALISQTV